MKVAYCFILERTDGGIIHARHFIEAYRQNGGQIRPIHQEPTYLSNRFNDKPLLKFLLAKTIWIFSNVRLMLKCIYCIISEKPDVFIFRHSLTHDNLLALNLVRLFFPVLLEVNAINEIESGTTSLRTRIKFDKLAISNANHLFVVSEPIKKFIVERNYCVSDKISIIPNGVNENIFNPATYTDSNLKADLGISPDSFIVGFIGNFKKWHGIGNVIAAAKACKDVLGNHIFLIVGDGATRSEYEAEVMDKGLTSTVKFIGRIPHDSVPAYLSIMDVVLSLHRQEPSNRKLDFHGSPLKLFEYMSMSKPVIASPVGQIKLVIKNGINGFLIKGEDSEAVKNTLLELQNQPHFRRQLGNNARITILESYTWRHNATIVEVLCRSIRRRHKHGQE